MISLNFLLIETLYFFLSSNAQVIFVNNAKTWADAQSDCESKGTNLLTAQGNTDVCYILKTNKVHNTTYNSLVQTKTT